MTVNFTEKLFDALFTCVPNEVVVAAKTCVFKFDMQMRCGSTRIYDIVLRGVLDNLGSWRDVGKETSIGSSSRRRTFEFSCG